MIDAPAAKVFRRQRDARLPCLVALGEHRPGYALPVRWSGTQGVGSHVLGEGNNQVGQGSQEIVASITNERVETDLVFSAAKGRQQSGFLLEPEGFATRLRWQFKTDFGWDLFGRYVGRCSTT